MNKDESLIKNNHTICKIEIDILYKMLLLGNSVVTNNTKKQQLIALIKNIANNLYPLWKNIPEYLDKYKEIKDFTI